MKDEIFAIEKANISINKTQIFQDLYITVYKKEILGIICDNPDEKQALQELFRGNARIASGIFRFKQEYIPVKKFNDYIPQNVTVISHTSRLIPALSIAENLTLFHKKNSSFIFNKEMQRKKAEDLLTSFNISINLDSNTKELSEVNRVTIEILQAFYRKHSVIVLSNPSDFLSRFEFTIILDLFYRLKDMGISIIIIDSLTSSLIRNTDAFLLIKDGFSLGCFDSKTVNYGRLKKYIMSHQNTYSFSNFYSNTDLSDSEDLSDVIRFENLCTSALHNINLSMFCGEVLKIVCADSKSITAFHQLLNGENQIISGSLSVYQKTIVPDRIEKTASEGILWLPYAPYKNYLVENLSVTDNFIADLFSKADQLVIRRNYLLNIQQFLRPFTGISDFSCPVRNFSLLTRQKLAYAKILLHAPALVFIESPFSEASLELKALTLDLISLLQKNGICVILLSRSLELLENIDGDMVYLKSGTVISENDMFEFIFTYGE